MVSKPIAWIVAAALAFGAACSSHENTTAAGPKPGAEQQKAEPATVPAKAVEPAKATETATAPAAASKAQETKPVSAPPPPPVQPAAAKATEPTTTAPSEKDWFITLERAKELYDKKDLNGRQVIFVDARTYVEFTDGHIRGAMCYSTKYTQGAPQAKLKNYLPGSAVVLYCRGELCQDSFDVGRYFQSLHLDIGPIFVIKDGFPGWEKAYPKFVDKGPEIGFD